MMLLKIHDYVSDELDSFRLEDRRNSGLLYGIEYRLIEANAQREILNSDMFTS
jgi:hypothetical protein